MDKKKNIGELLIEYGKITREDLQEGLNKQKELNLRLGETLVKLGKIRKSDIEWVLSKQLDIPFIIVDDINLDSKLINKFSKDLLLRNRILPIYETEEEIAIATDDPLNECIFTSIENYFNKKVKLSSANGEKIIEILQQFYKRSGHSVFLNNIENLLERINNTSFYRIDFIMSANTCKINIYGFGILKSIDIIYEYCTKEQILDSFESLNISLLFEYYQRTENHFLSVYPLINSTENIILPAITGKFGLLLPTDISFTDIQSYRLPLMITAKKPLVGYTFMSMKDRKFQYKDTIFTIDSSPEEFNDFYLDLIIPEQCSYCSKKGCSKCNELGYIFNEKLEGIYSSHNVKHILDKIHRWQR